MCSLINTNETRWEASSYVHCHLRFAVEEIPGALDRMNKFYKQTANQIFNFGFKENIDEVLNHPIIFTPSPYGSLDRAHLVWRHYLFC